jgi:hypothetical protein
MLNKKQYIFPSLSEGRQFQSNDVYSIKKIFLKSPSLPPYERPVGCRYEPYIHLSALDAANWPYFPVIHNSQQFGLQ